MPDRTCAAPTTAAPDHHALQGVPAPLGSRVGQAAEINAWVRQPGTRPSPPDGAVIDTFVHDLVMGH
ncbi:MAG: hypothetical protein KC613_25985 [Myxococcales bacterium]|nr:hypothetical protein [Myxococcales bacterium]MCB9522562.1 hypothetical protein [Myxococcales bacterium]